MKMLRIVLAVALFLVAPAARAQWATPSHSVPIGQGAGVIGFGSAAPGVAGLPFVSNGATIDPSFQALTNSGLATAPAATAKCNPTGGLAVVQDCTAAQLAALIGAPSLSANNTWTGANSYSGAVTFGGKPYFDVTSTANGCAAATLNGSTDDTAAIQCHVTYMNATFGGGVVYFPPSSACALVSGGGFTVPAGVWIIGSGLSSSCIDVATNSRTMLFANTGTTCPTGGHNGGLERISVFGFQNAGTTQPAVLVGDNCAITIRDTRLWFGTYGLETSGADGHYEDSFICGYAGCVHSHGANWFRRVKMDAIIPGTAPSASGFAYVQDTNFAGLSVAENYFDQSDFTCNCAGSIDVADAIGEAVTKFFNSVFDSPIQINGARYTLISGATFGSTSFSLASGSLAMSTSVGYKISVTVTGAGTPRSCAANLNITC